MAMFHNIVQDFKITKDDIPRIEGKLFFDGADRRKNLERFGTLMFFATWIAAFGVIADSTATVIGAMLIAPLMTPILATAAAVVTGQMPRAGRSLLTVVGGVIGAIAVSWLIGEIYRSGVISVTTNSQIVSRTAPRLVDLYAALGAGAVGAFATSREDIADTLPGAAIAIALVPPLAVVGLTLSQGAYSDAWGAMLLFLTNFFAILLAGSAAFALLGLSAAATSGMVGLARRRSVLVIIAGTLLVALPLAATSLNVAGAARLQGGAMNAAHNWVEGTSYQVGSVTGTTDSVRIRVHGEGDLPETAALIRAIEERLTRDITVRLEVVPSRGEEYSASPRGETE